MPLVSKGKDNLKNFQQLSLVTNNNISISQKGKYGSVRSSLTHVYNKGQYPNQKLNKVTYTVSGEMKWNKFSFDGGLTYNKRWYPNDMGAGYGGSGFLYNLLIWSGTEYDIRDYRNYWAVKNEQQNWMDKSWYDNPYFIANEIIRTKDYSLLNGYLSAKYDFTPWLQLLIRSGLDSYSSRNEWQNPKSALGGWDKNGYYCLQRDGGYSLNEDAMLSANHKFGNFELDGLLGGSIYYWKSDNLMAETQNGLKIPGYYSLKASVDPVRTTSGITKKQVNSIYAKLSANWKGTVFVDITGRNDWSSTLPSETRSYFYPSVAGSIVLSQFLPLPESFDFWKVRGSWTVTKKDLGVYDTNNTYSISTDLWNGESAAYYPSSIRGVAVKPSATRSYEIGTSMHFLKNRLRLDFTYYNKLYYNLTRSAGISNASGFSTTLINIDEEYVGKGVEIMISGDILRGKDWNWSSSLNFARDRWYYTKIDPLYSTQKPWVKEGARWDWFAVYDWERDTQGNLIHYGGYPKWSDYHKVVGYEYPDWTLGWLNTISYKNFTLSFTIDGRVGGVGHSATDNLCLFSRFPLEQQPSGDTFCSNPAIVRMGEGRSLLIDDCWLHYAYNPDYTGSFPDTGHNPSVWMAEDSIRPMADARRMLDDDLHPVLLREPMPVILGGDFNSCSHLDWTARTAHLHGGYGPVSFPTSRFLLERGYKDSFRELHPDEAAHPEGTFAGIYGQLDFSRIDFIYYKGGIRPIQSKIVQTPPEIDDIWASDHSAVLTTFVWE